MSKKQRQEKKKNKRREQVKIKLANSRRPLDQEKAADNALRKKIKKVKRVQKKLDENSTFSNEQLMLAPDRVLNQIEKNAEYLRQLEEEYKKEMKEKEEINKKLEEQGLYTLEEKLKHLHEEIATEQNLI